MMSADTQTGEMTLEQRIDVYRRLMSDVVLFSKAASRLRLRRYQEAVARAVVGSVLKGEGLSFVVMFPRQSGKNELQAQIETYLLVLFSQRSAEMVKISPTWKPQSQNAMRRLQRVLERNPLTCDQWEKEAGYIYRVGQARIFFLSGSPEASIVGATASTLLEVDEAQDVTMNKYDRDIAPMAASTNATRVFWGTAWTSDTLLARELKAARRLEEADGRRRAFVLTAGEVAAEAPAYGRFVAEQVARLGREHPMVKSQFFSEEIDAVSGLFPLERRSKMVGTHQRRRLPDAGRLYAFLIDVGGEEQREAGGSAFPEQAAGRSARPHDATALTIVEVDLAGMQRGPARAPVYRVMDRRLWEGAGSAALYDEIARLVAFWRPWRLVVDATGVGAGLASFLERAFRGLVIPFVFSAASKSKLGWDFLSIIETGRYQDWHGEGDPQAHLPGENPRPPDRLSDLFWQQVEACRSEVAPGPEQRLKWGVPDGRRDPVTGLPIHDDLLLSAALCAVLDGLEWASPGGAVVVRGKDPMEEMEQGF